MLITVQYKNGRTGRVEAYQLSHLICSQKIKKFLRSEGWVTIGRDPIRENICNPVISDIQKTHGNP
jgi:hypothetical protein